MEQEAQLDGIYVLRTSEPAERLSAEDTVRSYKSLAEVERLQAYLTANPNASPADILKQVSQNRDQIREQLGKVLSPDQMSKWDTAIKGAKEFLGEKLAA
jgi:hypothetical protein